MEYAAIASVVVGIISAIISSVSSAENSRAADERQFQYQKQLMDYQNQLQQETNTYATQKGHMASAGYSPALMYGTGMQQASVAGGSAQGSVPELHNMLNRIDPNNIYEAFVTKRAQDMQKERLQSDIAVNRQRELNLAADTAEKTRYTGLQKQLEKTIIDKSLADLHLTEVQSSNLEFMTRRGNALLPGELAQQGLLNEQTARQTEKIVSDTLKNSYEMYEIRAQVRRLDKLNEVSNEEIQSLRTDRSKTVEDVKRSALGRIMSEFGLNKIHIPAGFRGDWHRIWHNDQIKGATAALLSMGFDSDEAASAVLYYTASDPKDVTPSAVNAFSRMISAALLKK